MSCSSHSSSRGKEPLFSVHSDFRCHVGEHADVLTNLKSKSRIFDRKRFVCRATKNAPFALRHSLFWRRRGSLCPVCYRRAFSAFQLRAYNTRSTMHSSNEHFLVDNVSWDDRRESPGFQILRSNNQPSSSEQSLSTFGGQRCSDVLRLVRMLRNRTTEDEVSFLW